MKNREMFLVAKATQIVVAAINDDKTRSAEDIVAMFSSIYDAMVAKTQPASLSMAMPSRRGGTNMSENRTTPQM